MATEIELKLYCAPEEMARVESHPLMTAGNLLVASKCLENTYFDTPDLALHKEGIALRIRKTPTELLQTVKCVAVSVAGLSARPEWETPYTGAFDFCGVDAPKVHAFLKAHQSELVPVFTTSFGRKTWRIDVSKKIAIWVMLDSGQVSSGDRVLPISEVELELAQGKPEDLLDFAIALATHLPLVPHHVSKGERGYQLFLNRQPSPQKAALSPLHVKQTSAEAFEILATQGLHLWQANLLGALTSSDEEFVHQFRVSLRRLNSLIKVFKPALPDRFQRKWTKNVKKLSQITGDVRDLDVMRSGILQPMLQSDNPQHQTAAAAALVALDKDKQEALTQMQQLGYGGPILLFARDMQELATEDFPKNLPRFAEKQLTGLHHNALKRLEKTLKSPTPESAHRFRIALKHLRYSSEFFAPLFDNEEMLQFAKAIASLQDKLGFINDFHVALSRLQNWVKLGTVPNEVRDAIAEWHTAHAQEVLRNALQLAESEMRRCLPWCTECERRGQTPTHRRLKHDITL